MVNLSLFVEKIAQKYFYFSKIFPHGRHYTGRDRVEMAVSQTPEPVTNESVSKQSYPAVPAGRDRITKGCSGEK